MNKILTITTNKATREVTVEGYARFKLTDSAYTQNYINPNIASKVYIEVFNHKELGYLKSDYYGWYKKNLPVNPRQSSKVLTKMNELGLGNQYEVLTQESEISKRREVMFNNPTAYFIVATKLTKEVYNRCLQLLKYGNSPYLYVEDAEIYGIQLRSTGNTRSMLDQKFQCESNPDSLGCKMLNDLREYHESTIWEHCTHECQWLWDMMLSWKAERFYESNLPSIEDVQVKLDNLKVDFNIIKEMNSTSWATYINELFFKASAYGFNLKLHESEITSDSFCDPKNMFSNKPVAFAESSETIWDFPHSGRVERATVKRRQKLKLQDMPTSIDEIVNAIICVQWFESQQDSFYLDTEHHLHCKCGYPVSVNETHCSICNSLNEEYIHYDEEYLIPCMRDFVNILKSNI